MGTTWQKETKISFPTGCLPGKNSFKLQMTREGDEYPQWNKEVADQVGEQRVQGHMDMRDLVINSDGQKGVQPTVYT